MSERIKTGKRLSEVQREQREASAQAVAETLPTAQQLAAAEVLRVRDGITRAAAISRVRAMSTAEQQALVDAGKPPEKPKAEPVKQEPAVQSEAPAQARRHGKAKDEAGPERDE